MHSHWNSRYFLVFNIFSCLIIASYGVGVMTWESGEMFCSPMSPLLSYTYYSSKSKQQTLVFLQPMLMDKILFERLFPFDQEGGKNKSLFVFVALLLYTPGDGPEDT